MAGVVDRVGFDVEEFAPRRASGPGVSAEKPSQASPCAVSESDHEQHREGACHGGHQPGSIASSSSRCASVIAPVAKGTGRSAARSSSFSHTLRTAARAFFAHTIPSCSSPATHLASSVPAV